MSSSPDSAALVQTGFFPAAPQRARRVPALPVPGDFLCFFLCPGEFMLIVCPCCHLLSLLEERYRQILCVSRTFSKKHRCVGAACVTAGLRTDQGGARCLRCRELPAVG